MHAFKKKKHPCKGKKEKKRDKLALSCGIGERYGLFLPVVGGLFDLYAFFIQEKAQRDSLQYWGDQ